MWEVIANMAPVIVAKVLALGPNPSEEQLKFTAKEFSRMYRYAPELARSQSVKVWNLLHQLARRPLAEWSEWSKGTHHAQTTMINDLFRNTLLYWSTTRAC